MNRDSVVYIGSRKNSSFGSGFVIDRDKNGVFILTCQHVLDDVGTPIINNIEAEVIARSNHNIDMALLYVRGVQLEPLPIQREDCDSLDVEVIGFSHFSRDLNQKEYIYATLYDKPISLLSTESGLSHDARKIEAKDGFDFERGNSGSPVICKNSGNVIAMVSNKEGSSIGYAVDISNLSDIWENMPSKLFKKAMKRRSISPLIKVIKERKGVILTTFVVVAIFLLYPFIEAPKTLRNIKEKIKDLHYDVNETIPRKAIEHIDKLIYDVDDKYLFTLENQIEKYQTILYTYILAASVEADKKKQTVFFEKAKVVAKKTKALIEEGKIARIPWLTSSKYHVEYDTDRLIVILMILEIRATNDKDLIQKTKEKFLEIKSDYKNFKILNSKQESPEIEWFIKNHP